MSIRERIHILLGALSLLGIVLLASRARGVQSGDEQHTRRSEPRQPEK